MELPPPQPSFTLSRRDGASTWEVGRAEMLYRDLVPDRQGGRFIASHIRIPGGGPVPDYVHFHRIRFQLIYCHRGWVRVVYEDQGPPFVLHAGDCVLQPPEIRHEVLESSAGLEVVEVTCPAAHETVADPAVTLPTSVVQPARRFAGQTFVRHVAAIAPREHGTVAGFVVRDLGIAAATGGLAAARVLRPDRGTQMPAPERTVPADAELAFTFVLAGSALLRTGAHGSHLLGADDAFTLPPGATFCFEQPSRDLQLLEVALPAPG